MTHASSKVQYWSVDAPAVGQRIDNYLLGRLKGVPRSRVYKILRSGEVRLNKGRVKPNYRLQLQDVVRVPPVQCSEPSEPTCPAAVVIRLRAAILLETADLIVINKPTGMAVHGGSGLDWGVIEALRSARPGQYLELVHRLDKDTSGCLLVAKSAKMLKGLHRYLREGGMQKTYIALVTGFTPQTFSVQQPLLKYHLASGERRVKVHPEGKPAKTEFKLLQRLAGASLVQARLLTGRTHQIRVHASWRQYPIIGDDKYQGAKLNADLPVRLMLHATSLAFRCPVSGEPMQITAPQDEAFKQIVQHFTQGRDTDERALN